MAMTKDVESGLRQDSRDNSVETVFSRGSMITIPDVKGSTTGNDRISARTYTVRVRSLENGNEKLDN